MLNFSLSLSRDFKMEDGKAEIPLNVTVQGDVLVVIYHARSTLGGRLQAKVYTHTHTHTCCCLCWFWHMQPPQQIYSSLDTQSGWSTTSA